MRRFLLLSVVTGLVLANAGCFLNIYSSDPNRRMNELLNNSEDLRQIENAASKITVQGDRYPEHLEQMTGR